VRSGTKCNWFGALIINWRLHFKCGMPRPRKGGSVCSPSETPKNFQPGQTEPALQTLQLSSIEIVATSRLAVCPWWSATCCPGTVAGPYDGRPKSPALVTPLLFVQAEFVQLMSSGPDWTAATRVAQRHRHRQHPTSSNRSRISTHGKKKIFCFN